MAKIVVVGSLNMDIVAVSARLPLPGETLKGTHYLNEPGGKGANQGYAAAKLGGNVAMLGRVGKDDFGKRNCANLAAVGCNVDAVKAIDGSSGVALIFVAQSGQNSIVIVPGANDLYSPEDFREDVHRLAEAQYVLLQLEIPLPTVLAAAQAGRQHGAKVILDPAPAPTALPTELLRHVDILTPNELEAAQLIGRTPGDLNLDDARSIAQHLRAMGAATVIIKLGAQGCLLADRTDPAVHIAAPQVQAVDTTAAGDIFNASFAVACAEGAALIDACRFAVRTAALSVTRLGAQPSMPTRAEADRFNLQAN